MKKSIAVIGQGFVGGSLTTVFSERGFSVYTYDITGKQAAGGKHPCTEMTEAWNKFAKPATSILNLVASVEVKSDFSNIYFVCLPTPMKEDGSCDVSIVEGVLNELATIPGERIAVIKSTVPPGTTMKWNQKFEETGLRVIFNPEFLTEANALDDMRNQNRIVLGGPRPHINRVKQIFQTAFPKVPLIKTSSTTAEMVKYLTNNFLTVKVAFANEMSQICEALDRQGLDIDYDKVIEYATYDTRLGDSHWAVPGPDGSRGFGGSCFPKDINAMIAVEIDLGLIDECEPKTDSVLAAAWRKNIQVRPERDWEKLVGRAVVGKKK